MAKVAPASDAPWPEIVAPAPEQMEREPFVPPPPLFATDEEAAAWAKEWFAAYSVSPHDSSLYHSHEGLLSQLRPGPAGGMAPVRMVKLSFLEAWAKQVRATPGGKPLPRRQELERDHPEAFLSAEEVAALPRGYDPGKKNRPLRVLGKSHGWLTPQHPDPHGKQLLRFVEQVGRERRLCPGGAADTRLCCLAWLCPLSEPTFRAAARDAPALALCYVCCCPLCVGASEGCCCGCIPGYGQGWCRSSKSFPRGEAAVFYDFASLAQKDDLGERTDEERAAFDKALETMGSWYAHRLTTTFSMSMLPEGYGAVPYEERGWTTFERAVSSLVKPSNDMSWRRLADPVVVRKAAIRTGAYRDPPVLPEEFAARLARKRFTNGKSDCELVAGIYADTFAGALGGAAELDFEACGWGDEEVARLAKALPFAREATVLNLNSNLRIGARGLDALAAALREGAAPKLRKLSVDQAPSAAAAGLRAACEARSIAFKV